jgi:hypothetical protein
LRETIKELPADEREHLLRSLNELQGSVFQAIPEVFRGFQSGAPLYYAVVDREKGIS